MHLYELLPAIIREKDRLGSGVGSGTSETVLQKFLYALEQDCDLIVTQIENLHDLLNPDSCPEAYMPYLEYFLGSDWPGTWTEDKKRLVLKSLVKLYHHSGQRLSWTSILNLLGHSGFFPWELWKQDVYEDFDYSLYGYDSGDYYYLYHAARVDIRKPNTHFKSLTDDEKALIETFRPIHVLIRTFGERRATIADTAANVNTETIAVGAQFSIQETLRPASEVCVITETCVAQCEVGCEVGVEP